MRFPGFIGPTYTLNSVDVDCQRCINLYPEMNELGTGKDREVASLIGTPGKSLFATVGIGPHRGSWTASTGACFVVSGPTLYRVNADGTNVSLGNLLTSSGPVGISDNAIQLVVVDGANGYYVTLGDDTSFTQITDPNFSGSDTVTFQDGYFIFTTPNSRESYLSDLDAITFTAPATFSKEGFPDNTVAAISCNRNLWLLGVKSLEVWFDSGDNLNPFQYIQGSMSKIGLVSPFAVCEVANTIAWLGRDENGQGIVFMAQAYNAQRISNHSVETAIQKYSTISDATAYSYQENGHNFFILNFPTANATWVFDFTSGMWHERASLNNGQLQRDRGSTYTFAFGKHLVGDWQNGNLYQMSSQVYSDNGNPLPRIRVTPHISNSDVRIFYSEMQLDIEPGVGIDGTGQGTNPQAILQWSNDGGHTWSNELWTSIGMIGHTKNRAIWRKLGHARNRVFKVTITDPVKVNLIGADIELELGTG